MEEANGHKQRVISTAEGDASRFKQVQTEYAKAPEVTRQRMYLETMQQVYSNTSKVLIDAKGQGNLLYLPLDKLMQATAATAAAAAETPTSIQSGRPAAPLSSEVPPQLEQAPAVGGKSYSGSSREGSLSSRDRESR